LFAFLISIIHATCPAHLILLDLITLIIFGEEFKLWHTDINKNVKSKVTGRRSNEQYEYFEWTEVWFLVKHRDNFALRLLLEFQIHSAFSWHRPRLKNKTTSLMFGPFSSFSSRKWIIYISPCLDVIRLQTQVLWPP